MSTPSCVDAGKLKSTKDEQELAYHLGLLGLSGGEAPSFNEINTTALFSMPVLRHAQGRSQSNEESPFCQYGLLGGVVVPKLASAPMLAQNSFGGAGLDGDNDNSNSNINSSSDESKKAESGRDIAPDFVFGAGSPWLPFQPRSSPIVESSSGEFNPGSSSDKKVSKATQMATRGTVLAQSEEDPRIFFNVAAPSSTFICGSQGSGKSHTLSCLLENCLLPSGAGKLPKPLAGLLFHYDNFTSDVGGSACEAAFLASANGIEVRVLCSPSNLTTMKRIYKPHNVKVEPLRISQSDLNTGRMLDLMAVTTTDGPVPLYLHTLTRILRIMRTEQQQDGNGFSYRKFKAHLDRQQLSPMQMSPLNLRLDLLESFLPPGQISPTPLKGVKKEYDIHGNRWAMQSGCLTIVDLSCPFVSAEAACSLFNICLSVFLEQDMTIGRVVALDEAHKYMNESTEASKLTSALLSTIRLQRHAGVRVLISTQEPTISPKLLDLCTVTIVHRFTSPEWLKVLQSHLAGAYAVQSAEEDAVNGKRTDKTNMLDAIMRLNIGEALLFSPSAMLRMVEKASGDKVPVRLGADYLKIRVRARISADGGKSIMAK